jgi:hypothetical protein
MFQQYNISKKIMRIIIFILLVTLSFIYIPENKLNNDDMCKLICAITLIFVVYDFYYPAVRIELKKDKKE